MKVMVLFFVGLVAGIVLYHYTLLPLTIDRRAERLGIMKYDSAEDRMIPTDEMKWTLHYLKQGKMQ